MKINYNKEDLTEHYGIAAVIKDKESRILMQNHVKYNFWTIPVGKVPLNKSPEEGLKQEIYEECGIKVQKLKQLAKEEMIYIRGNKKVKVIEILFEVIEYSGEVKNKEPEKHKEQKFMAIKEIEKLPYLSNQTLRYLKISGIKKP